ncbi:hypothetical protein CYMTET_46297 [Cymbomonas tetramitiformis]|uniref:Uncharacterized protein n=1 Tax=Cymbomonas tetramitiformis TaxID=36881 RepID=A0AAE0BWG4_9CHLO|nr:hypothetical protein CYMTET_46297 [Cymbomonas tetramitiformis]
MDDVAAAEEASPTALEGAHASVSTVAPLLAAMASESSFHWGLEDDDEVRSAVRPSVSSPAHSGGAPPSPTCSQLPSPMSTPAMSGAASVSAGHTATRDVRKNEVLSQEMLLSNAGGANSYGRNAVGDVIHDVRYDAREDILVSEAISNDIFGEMMGGLPAALRDDFDREIGC